MKRTTGSRTRAVLALLVLALAVATAATAMAVEVRGTLRIPADYGRTQPDAEQERRNHYWDEWNGFLEPRPRRFEPGRELAVVLTGGEGGMFEEQPGFTITNGTLMPRTIVERAGGTLRIHNTDPVTHKLFADGLAGFTPSPVSAGLVRSQTLPNAAGNWPLKDQLYPHVSGHLHVLADLRARASVQPDGTFIFRNVQGGTYTLRIFHGAREVHSAEVVVPADRELVVDPIAIGAAPSQ